MTDRLCDDCDWAYDENEVQPCQECGVALCSSCLAEHECEADDGDEDE